MTPDTITIYNHPDVTVSSYVPDCSGSSGVCDTCCCAFSSAGGSGSAAGLGVFLRQCERQGNRRRHVPGVPGNRSGNIYRVSMEFGKVWKNGKRSTVFPAFFPYFLFFYNGKLRI